MEAAVSMTMECYITERQCSTDLVITTENEENCLCNTINAIVTSCSFCHKQLEYFTEKREAQIQTDLLE